MAAERSSESPVASFPTAALSSATVEALSAAVALPVPGHRALIADRYGQIEEVNVVDCGAHFKAAVGALEAVAAFKVAPGLRIQLAPVGRHRQHRVE